MKRIFTIVILILMALNVVLAQNQKLSYQAVVRNNANELVANENITVVISISDATNNSAYSETHNTSTNRNGVISLMIGDGSGKSGNIANVEWRTASIHTKITLADGTVLNNTTPVTAVPYALFAENAISSDGHFIVNTNESCNDTLDLCALKSKLEELKNKIYNLNVNTGGISNVTQTSFTVTGEVTADGGEDVTERGFVYSTTNANPTTNDTKKQIGSGLGIFSTTITGLNPGITYYVRAYAKNNSGIAYGASVSATTTALSPSSIPSVQTVAVSDITRSSVIVKGNISSNGGEPITASGFCYDTLSNPTTNSSNAANGCTLGAFSNFINNLTPGKTYYIRAYAKNSIGTAYGEEVEFTTLTNEQIAVGNDGKPCEGTPTVTDHEGNVYNTVQIGTQCWTKENMRATTSPSTGTYLVPPVGTTYSVTGKQAKIVKNNEILYNWNAVVDTFNENFGELSIVTLGQFEIKPTFVENRRGICPAGWHVPSSTEWNILISYVSSKDVYVYEYSTYYDATLIAKSLCTSQWVKSLNTGAVGYNSVNNNLTGFSAISVGVFEYNSYTSGSNKWEYSEPNGAFWWTSSYGCNRYIKYDNGKVYTNYDDYIYDSQSGKCMSVRCVKD